MDREVAAAGGLGGEIFLEVAGKQASWHTPSWRVLRSNAGQWGGGAQLGEPRGLVGGGDQGGTDPSLCLSQGQRDIPVPRSWGRRKEEGSFLRSRDSPIDTREGAPSNSIQPPPHTGTPALPYLGEPRTHVGSSGGRGLSRLSLECKVRRGAS